MEVALLHVWNSGHTVSDAVFRAWSRLWPSAEQQTTSHNSQNPGEPLGYWDRLSGETPDEPVLLPMERNYDLILSTSPEASKEFLNCHSRLHLCYLPNNIAQGGFTQNREIFPLSGFANVSSRFAWTQRLPVTRHAYLTPSDHAACQLPEQVTHWISASRSVRELNGLPTSMHSLVLYPPIDTQCFRPLSRQREGFYLAVCRDRVIEGLPLAAKACEQLGRKFLIAATPEIAEKIPKSLRNYLEVYNKDSALAAWYNRCAGVIFPSVIDFDPSILEAQACGAPVIAYKEGVSLELVIDSEECQQGTGIFFEELEVGSLMSAIEELERRPQRCSPPLGWTSAAAYSEGQFEKRTIRLIHEVLKDEGIRTLERELRAQLPPEKRRDAA